MRGPNTLNCEGCGGPTQFRAPKCGYCHAPLTWGSTVEIAPGDEIARADMARDSLPGWSQDATAAARRGDACAVELKNGMVKFGTFATPACDACISVSGVCLDDQGKLGALARYVREGAAQSYYGAWIHPGRRRFTLERVLGTPQSAEIEVLTEWEVSSHVAPVGALNRVELRCADSVLDLVVNGERVATVVDARFGFGHFGWRASPVTPPSTLLIHSVELRHIR